MAREASGQPAWSLLRRSRSPLKSFSRPSWPSWRLSRRTPSFPAAVSLAWSADARGVDEIAAAAEELGLPVHAQRRPPNSCPVVTQDGQPCTNVVASHGMCQAHARRRDLGWSTEDMQLPVRRSLRRAGPRTCELVDYAGNICGTRAMTHGLCSTHSARVRRGWTGTDLGLPLGTRMRAVTVTACTVAMHSGQLCDRSAGPSGICESHRVPGDDVGRLASRSRSRSAPNARLGDNRVA